MAAMASCRSATRRHRSGAARDISAEEWHLLGPVVGARVGLCVVGEAVGFSVGVREGEVVGVRVGATVGLSVGDLVGAADGAEVTIGCRRTTRCSRGMWRRKPGARPCSPEPYAPPSGGAGGRSQKPELCRSVALVAWRCRRARHRKRGRHAMTDTWQQRSMVQVPDQHGRVLRPTPASKTYTEAPLAL